MKNFFKNPKNLSVGFRIKPLRKSVFLCYNENYSHFAVKRFYFREAAIIYLSTRWITLFKHLTPKFFFWSSCAKLSFLWVLLPARKRITCSCTSKHCVNRNQMGVDNIWCIAFFKYTKSQLTKLSVPTNIYLFKVNERNTRSLRRSNALSLLLTLNVIDTIF